MGCWPIASAARRALAIGLDDYVAVSKLRNAHADAVAMAAALRKAGYDVEPVPGSSAGLQGIKDALRAFREKIRGEDDVVFYFSGHGVQIGGMNYLLPADVRVANSEGQVRDDAISLGSVLEDFRAQSPRFTLAIIDACRDNPFQTPGRSIGGRGLTGVGGATGQMVIYSAGEGQRALDRLSDADPIRNGVFTRVFLREMERPGVLVQEVLRNVRRDVHRLAQEARHLQVPAIYDQTLGEFYFYPPAYGMAQVPGATSVPVQSSFPSVGADEAMYRMVAAGFDLAAIDRFLSAYPNSAFVPAARERKRQIEHQERSEWEAAAKEVNPIKGLQLVEMLNRAFAGNPHTEARRHWLTDFERRAALFSGRTLTFVGFANLQLWKSVRARLAVSAPRRQLELRDVDLKVLQEPAPNLSGGREVIAQMRSSPSRVCFRTRFVGQERESVWGDPVCVDVRFQPSMNDWSSVVDAVTVPLPKDVDPASRGNDLMLWAYIVVPGSDGGLGGGQWLVHGLADK